MSQFMGVGTTLYGEKMYDKNDHSYTATKWFIIFFFPLFPLATYRVKRLKTELKFNGLFSAESQYELMQIPIDVNQVVITYLFGYSVIPLWFWLMTVFESHSDWAMGFVFLIPVGFLLRSAYNRGSFS